jgi:hypothetical protein
MLVGLGDPKLMVQKILWMGQWGFMPSVSASIPLGKTEDNPYLRAQESQIHQHIQMGTGTVVPSVGVTVFRDEVHWGMLHSITQSLPFYENQYQYLPGRSTDWSIGYWRRLNTKLVLLAQTRGSHEDPEIWMDLPYSGRDAIALNLTTFFRFHPKWELGLQLERNIWIQSRANEEDPLNPILIWNLSITR